MSRTDTRMALIIGAVVAVVLVAVAALGGTDRVIDASVAAEQVVKVASEPTGLSMSLSCPDGVEATAGVQFTCTGTSDGTKVAVDVTVAGEDGTRFRVTAVRPG